MRSRAGVTRARQKAAVMTYRCWSVCPPFRLNSLFDLFIQRLWNNIAAASQGKFTSFTARDGGWRQTTRKAAYGTMRMGNKVPHRSGYSSTIQATHFSTKRTSVHARSAPTAALQAVADTAQIKPR
ncbi:hypothetical protein KCP76_20835 [Salmonella enterica subsp. enterica serovar Weltevreden]|nr:hypothetical protein KCP76_20835 [Salmonella enterica subsp. enterica serovar Weltevreden]